MCTARKVRGGVLGRADISQLGYHIDGLVDQLTNGNNNGLGNALGSDVKNGLTYALVLAPITAGLAALAVLFGAGSNLIGHVLGSIVAFFAWVRARSRTLSDAPRSFRSSSSASSSACSSTVRHSSENRADRVARHNLRDAGFSASLGNSVWCVTLLHVAGLTNQARPRGLRAPAHRLDHHLLRLAAVSPRPPALWLCRRPTGHDREASSGPFRSTSAGCRLIPDYFVCTMSLLILICPETSMNTFQTV